jgi:drug/metabolite transporter (DMT)-like permease
MGTAGKPYPVKSGAQPDRVTPDSTKASAATSAAAQLAARTTDLRTNRPLSGIGLTLAAVCCFGVLDVTAKTVVTAVPLLMAIWVRYAIQALLSTAILWPTYGKRLLRTANPRLQALRGTMLLVSSLFAFASLVFIPVGEFTAIVMITPLVITVIAHRVLKEYVSPLQWVFVAGGFVGALLIIRPGGSGFHWGWLLPLAVVASNTWFQLLTSRLARSDNPSTTHFYTGWVGTGLATLALPFVWTAVPDTTVWLRMVLMGSMGAVGHYCLTMAYTRAPAATLMPYLYGQIGAAMLLGFLFLHHVPDEWALIGMAIIAACGAGGAWLSASRARQIPGTA